MKYYIILLLTTLSVYGSYDYPQSNKVIFDSLANKYAEKLIEELKFLGKDSITINYDDNEEVRYLINILIEKSKSLNFKFKTSGTEGNITISNKANPIDYKLNENDDVIRKINCEYYIIYRHDSELETLDIANVMYSDIINPDSHSNIQNNAPAFLKKDIAGVNDSFLDNILKPIVIISTGIIAAVLLYTVRSK